MKYLRSSDEEWTVFVNAFDNEYNYVSLKWYKKYLSFVDQIEVENRNKLRKIGINPNEIEAEIEE